MARRPEARPQPPLLAYLGGGVGMEPGPGDLDWETLATKGGFRPAGLLPDP